ncbi:caspase family protein [Microbispora cellulosiformans]|uniref:Caspase family protein n=1 Tax=Microbispora cellulosiformans TaxID=2614688 RepID=A0A5J5JRJ0_9ACTN|nr:caspase family protein [Microbispora cellulosiformans]KAA9373679.1 caspase family protein [Microbispora cellulosiformans]
MAAETTRLTIRLTGADAHGNTGENADPRELEDLTARLRAELLEIDVLAAQNEAGAPPPPGTRAVLSFALGGLVVSLARTDLLAAVVSAVTAWLTRDQHRSAKLTIDGDAIELTGVPSGEQRRLTDLWVRRHEGVRQGDAGAPAGARTALIGAGAPAGRRTALIVAGDDYRDPGLRRLRAPARDAEALARVLGDPAIGGFDVRTLLNEPTHVVSEMVEEFFTDRAPDDVLLLHFSCHGVKDDNGELYFATPTTKLNRLGATAVSAEFVNRRMSRSRSRRMILLLDCCYAGAWARGALPRAGTGVHVEEQFGGSGRVVITASNAMEYAFDGTELADAQEQAPSVFTRALVEGLESGDADRDQDGYVDIDELYDYVYDKVRQTTPGQTPGKWTFDLQGDLHVARRARPVTVPSPLPAELQAVVDNSIPRVRAGAVEELRRLLRSRHEGLALAARLTLEELADDDSRMVSKAAAEALTTSKPRPAPEPAPAPAPASAPAPQPTPSAPPSATPPAPSPGLPTPASETQPAPPVRASAATKPLSSGPSASSVAEAEPPEPTEPSGGAAGPGNRLLRALRPHGRAFNPRAVALPAAFLLASAPLSWLTPVAAIWQWLLVAATLGTGLLPPNGKVREVACGLVTGLGAVMLALLAFFTAEYGSSSSMWIVATGTLLILAAVMLEGAPETTRWSWFGERAVGLIAVAVVVAHFVSPERITRGAGETPQWWGAMVVSAVCLCLFVVRVVEQRRDSRALIAFVLGAAATVLVVTDLGREEVIRVYLPTLLVMLLLGVRPASGRPEFLAAARLSLVAGVLQGVADHGLANRANPPFATYTTGHLIIQLVAALLVAIAAYTAGRRTRSSHD